MRWTINVVGALFLTTATGSILFVFWYMIGRKLDRMGYVNILYDILRINSILFCVPFVYVLMGYLDDNQGIFGGVLFLHTGTLMEACGWIFRVWRAGALCMLFCLGAQRIWLEWDLRKSVAATLEEQEQFREVGCRLGIPEGRVLLYRSYHVPSPCMAGILVSRVYMPEETYTEKEREIIFLHELTHYQQGDLWLKGVTLVILCVYWFNPLVYVYSRMVGAWSEYACDYRASLKAGRVNDYMRVLGEMSLKKGRKPVRTKVMLVEKEKDVVVRLKRLKEYQVMEKRPKVQAAAVCVALCLLSSATVFAASAGTANQYREWYRGTVEEFEEELQEAEELEEYIETENTPGVVEETGETFGKAQFAAKHFNWTVGNDVRKKTEAFCVEEARSIEVHVTISLAYKQVKLGIIEPDGAKRYVLVTGSGIHEFLVKNTGDYQIFVENTSGVSVEVGGGYVIR